MSTCDQPSTASGLRYGGGGSILRRRQPGRLPRPSRSLARIRFRSGQTDRLAEGLPVAGSIAWDHAKRWGDGAGSNRKAGRCGARTRPSRRQGMGGGHRDRAQRHHHGACHDDPEHLADGRLDRRARRCGTRATDCAIADASDRAANRRRGRHHARRRGRPFRSRQAARPACWRGRLPDGCGIDREDARTAARGG